MGRKTAARTAIRLSLSSRKDCVFFVVLLLALWHPSTPDYVSLSLSSLYRTLMKCSSRTDPRCVHSPHRPAYYGKASRRQSSPRRARALPPPLTAPQLLSAPPHSPVCGPRGVSCGEISISRRDCISSSRDGNLTASWGPRRRRAWAADDMGGHWLGSSGKLTKAFGPWIWRAFLSYASAAANCSKASARGQCTPSLSLSLCFLSRPLTPPFGGGGCTGAAPR